MTSRALDMRVKQSNERDNESERSGSGGGSGGGGGSGSGGRDEIYLEHFHTVDATKHGMYNLKCLEVSQTPDVGAAWYVVFFLSQLN